MMQKLNREIVESMEIRKFHITKMLINKILDTRGCIYEYADGMIMRFSRFERDRMTSGEHVVQFVNTLTKCSESLSAMGPLISAKYVCAACDAVKRAHVWAFIKGDKYICEKCSAYFQSGNHGILIPHHDKDRSFIVFERSNNYYTAYYTQEPALKWLAPPPNNTDKYAMHKYYYRNGKLRDGWLRLSWLYDSALRRYLVCDVRHQIVNAALQDNPSCC